MTSDVLTPDSPPQTLATLDDMRERIRKKSRLKGRQADEASLLEVQALIGAAPHRRDLLIEHLHQLNDQYRGLHERHLTALAKLMNLPLRDAREVFEREYLVAQINRFGGNISRTAEFIGMERSALHRKLKSLAIDTRD